MTTAILQQTPRGFRQTTSERITDFTLLLLELITNSDDAYQSIQRKMNVWIEYSNKKLRYGDSGPGMTFQEQCAKLTKSGEYTATKGARGFFGTGAKDIILQVDKIEILSIKNGIFYRSQWDITKEAITLRPVNDHGVWIDNGNGRPATAKDYKECRLKQGESGLIFVLDGIRLPIPRFDNFCTQLIQMPQLRSIFVNDKSGIDKIEVIRGEESRFLEYEVPQGEHKLSTTIKSKILDCEIKLIVRQSKKPLEDYQCGFVITSGRTTFEQTFFDPAFKNCADSKYIFGELRIPEKALRGLLEEYDQIEAIHGARLPNNPSLVVRPNRKEGLEKTHPFIKDIFMQVKEILEADVFTSGDAANALPASFRDEFLRLAMEEMTDDEKNLSDEDEAIKDDSFKKLIDDNGVYIYPQAMKLFKEQSRHMTIYISEGLMDLIDKEKQTVEIELTQADPPVVSMTRRKTDTTRGTRSGSRKFNLPIRPVSNGKYYAAQVTIESKTRTGTVKVEATCGTITNKASIDVTNYKIDGLMQFFRPKFNCIAGKPHSISLDINKDEIDIDEIKSIKITASSKLIKLEYEASNIQYNEEKGCLECWIKLLPANIAGMFDSLKTVQLSAELKYIKQKRKGASIKVATAQCEIIIRQDKKYIPANVVTSDMETASLFSWAKETESPTLIIYSGNKTVSKIMCDPQLYRTLILIPAFATRKADKTVDDGEPKAPTEVAASYNFAYQSEISRLARKIAFEK